MKKLLLTLILLISLTILYGRYIAINKIATKTYTISSKSLPNSFNDLKIVQFSDTLFKKDNIDNIDMIVNEINKAKPDIVFFTGDLIFNNEIKSKDDINKIIKGLKNINCNLYKYAIIGNNDKKNIKLYEQIMEDSNFKLLDDESTYLFYKDKNPLKIIGINNVNKYNELLINEDGINPIYNIVLMHESDNIDKLKLDNINLVLSGNSLGGLIKVPFVGSIIKQDDSKKYIDDYYKVNNTDIYVSNGIGTKNINFRLFNKPSINKFIIEK